MSVTGETFASWATRVTGCSNPTFNRVVNRLWENPSLQKDVLAVLTGVTKLIQSRGGCESAAEYYAALLLLSLGRILSVQPTENWAAESVRHTYRIFLRFIDYDKAALRKAAHKVISELLTFAISTEDTYHPVCHQTINHICKLIRQVFTELSSLIRITDSACGRLLCILNLLKAIICLIPEKDIKLACECVLELTAFSNPLVLKSAFECLQTLFQGRVKTLTVSLDTAGKLMTALLTCKPRESTSVDIATLQKDSESLIAWLKCLCAGVCYLTSLAIDNHDEKPTELAPHVAVEHLEHLVRAALSTLVNSPLPDLRISVKRLLVDVFLNPLTEQLQMCNLLTRRPRFLPELCLTLQNALNLARHETWPSLLNVSSCLIHAWAMKAVVGNSVDIQLPAEVIDLIQRVANLRDALADGAEGVVYDSSISVTMLVDEMDRLVLTSMESWGIEPVLRDALPLESLVLELESGIVELRRSWILPLIARVRPARSCSLAFFHSNILPLADRAVTVAKAAAGQKFKRQIGGESNAPFVPLSAILNAAVQMARQLWITLTAFTRRCPSRWADLVDSGLGGRLIAGLLTSKTIRPVILSALRRLVTFAETEEAITVMRSGAKQMVPKMLSMYEELDSTNDQQLKQQLGSTLSVFLPLLTPKVLSVPCEMAYKKLVTTKRPIYMEILMLIVPNLTSESIKSVLDQLEEYFLPKDRESRVLRKPAYRLLEAVLSSPNPSAKEFVVANLTSLTTFMAQITPPSTEVADGTGTEIESTDYLSSTMAALALSAKERKALAITTPWKARLRILRHLLRVHAERQRKQPEEGCGNHAVQEFVNIFMPEIPQCLGSLNSLVRVLAGRLLVDMVLATAGSLSLEGGTLPFGRLQRSPCSLTASPSELTRMDDDGEGDEDGSEVEEVEGIGGESDNADDDGSISGQSCNPTEIASVCTSISITGVDPLIAMKTCAGLRSILSHLWPVVLEVNVESLKNVSQSQLLRLEVTVKSICRLLSDLRLRRCLMTALQEVEDTKDTLDAAEVLSTANRAAQGLVQLPSKHIARLGLQISRLLIAFVGHSVYVSDIVVSIHQIHANHKQSLRFMVKAMVEKLLKKVSVQALFSLMSPEYHKMIRNSAKLLRRREQKSKIEERKKGAKSTSGNVDEDDGLGTAIPEGSVKESGRSPSVSGASLRSLGSALSLSKHIHVQNLQEILSTSNEGDEGGGVEATARQKAASENQKATERPHRRLGLAAELECAASVAGLSRRSRRNLLRGARGESSDEGDEDFDDFVTTRRVRFADDVAKLYLAGKRRRQRADAGGDAPSMTYLVEDAEDEVVDLAEPESLARHLTVASSAQLAKRALKPDTLTPAVSASKRARLTSLSFAAAFPTSIDGKLIINEATVKDRKDGWSLNDADDDGAENDSSYSMAQGASIARAAAAATERIRTPRLPGAEYRSSRAEGDMRKPGRPDPFAYAPLGAGLSNPKRRVGSSNVATATERRALLRYLGVGKRKRKQKQGKKMDSVSAAFHQGKVRAASSNLVLRRQKSKRGRK
ncbi:rrp12 protein [Echinococcus multilocularis]|uniref:Rrp12 protein n=1 Tax=Echinococcus multilocularis TaxID=6211 RepID=A0A068Y589_ECHMU|nr:rrp12 protein [Echinococcus multilocularis]